MMKKYVVVMVACSSLKEARRIGDTLLSKRIVACANIVSGVESRFWWKGSLDGATESLLIMKTVTSNFKKIESLVKSIHSYEVPEIIALPISSGSRDYLDWISDSIV